MRAQKVLGTKFGVKLSSCHLKVCQISQASLELKVSMVEGNKRKGRSTSGQVVLFDTLDWLVPCLKTITAMQQV